tara:strand:+ start:179488 stop:181038 length:1551 start_codon:yes stop_codon:yes gene_type:complete
MKKTIIFSLLLFGAVIGNAQNQNISQGNIFDGEPFLAVNPQNSKHIVVAWMGYQWLNQIQINIKISQDAGNTWSNEITIPHMKNGYTSADPSMIFDNNGNLYLCYIDFKTTKDSGSVVVRKSTDGGYTWSQPSVVVSVQDDAPRIPIDRPWISIDTLSGNLFVTTMNAKGALPDYHPYFFVSTDDNASWSSFRTLDTTGWLSGNLIPQPMPTNCVSSAGVFYAAYPSYVSSQNILPQFILAQSATGGSSFNYSTLYASANSGVGDSLAKSGYLLRCNPADANHLAFFMLQKNGQDGANVMMLESFDAGNSWGAPQQVNDDIGTRLQDMIWASFDKDGDIVVTWRDRRNGTNDTYQTHYEFYAAVKPSGASQFNTNFAISDIIIPYDTILASSGNDFMCNQVINDTAYAVWGDTRDGKLNIWMQKFTTSGQLLSLQNLANSNHNTFAYPNPAIDAIYIESSFEKGNLTVFSIEGKEIIRIDNYVSKQKININNLPKGLYFYVLTTENKEIKGQFIKE